MTSCVTSAGGSFFNALHALLIKFSSNKVTARASFCFAVKERFSGLLMRPSCLDNVTRCPSNQALHNVRVSQLFRFLFFLPPRLEYRKTHFGNINNSTHALVSLYSATCASAAATHWPHTACAFLGTCVLVLVREEKISDREGIPGANARGSLIGAFASSSSGRHRGQARP